MSGALRFGVFPLGLAGSPDGVASGTPDDSRQIGQATWRLQGDGAPLPARMYVLWPGARSTPAAPGQVTEMVSHQVPWDLVLCYRDPTGEIEAWTGFVSRVVTDCGHQLAAVQVTGEANLAGIPVAADRAFPRAVEALVGGVLAATAAKRRAGASVELDSG